MIAGSLRAPAFAQELLEMGPPGTARAAEDTTPLSGSLPDSPPLRGSNDVAPLTQADSANLDGCQVVARIDDQIILACDVLWRVNQLIESQKQKMGADIKITPE